MLDLWKTPWCWWKRGHCHITGKFRGAVHWGWKLNQQLAKKVPVFFCTWRDYDNHLIFNELNDVIPHGLEKYMAFIQNKNLIFIDSLQFMNCSNEKLVKNYHDQ